VTVSGAAQAARGSAGEDSSRSSESARRIERASAAAMAMQRRDWEQGIFAQALVEAGDHERVILLTKAAIVQRTPDGRLAVVVSGSPTDPAMGGAAYAQAAEWAGDAAIRQAVDTKQGAAQPGGNPLPHLPHARDVVGWAQRSSAVSGRDGLP
jgi:hypothetical protein